MFFWLFNFLVKRTYFGLALVIPGLAWAIFSAIFGVSIVLSRADFAATGTEKTFIYSIIFSAIAAVLIGLIEFGFFRLFGIKWENKNIRVLNDNIIKGKIKSKISNNVILEIYNSLDKTINLLINRNLELVAAVIIVVILAEYFSSRQLTNIPIILIAGFVSASLTSIFNPLVSSENLFSYRKECKNLLYTRNIAFEERSKTFLRDRFRFVILLLFLLFMVVLFFFSPLRLNLIILSLVGLIMIITAVNAIFLSFFGSLEEIKKSAEKLETGERDVFFSGSTDREIIDFSESLRKTAQNIINYQEELNEAKIVLEIKVKARTKELEELAKGLDEKVKERTKELQEKIEELERFHRLAVGRELKMLELKEEIKKLEEELKKYKPST